MFNLNTQKIKYIITGIIIGATLSTSIAFADLSEVKLIINGKQIQSDVAPQMINGRVFVPVRLVSENLGANVKWDNVNNSVIIDSCGEQQTTKSIQSQISTNNTQDEYVEIKNYHDSRGSLGNNPPVKYKGNVYFPLWYIIRISNLHEKYDESTKILSFKDSNIKLDTTNKNDFIIYKDRTYIKNGILCNISISN